MLMEKFGLDELATLCGGATAVARVLEWHEVNPSGKTPGVWVRPLSEEDRIHLAQVEAKVVRWHPRNDARHPALPFPFNAYEFASFGLAGGGSLLSQRFYDGPDIDEDELNELEGLSMGYLSAMVRQAHALVQGAYRQQRIEDGRSDRKQPRDPDVAAKWLLAEAARLEAAERIQACSSAATSAASVPSATQQAPTINALDYSKLVTREALIAAFGSFTGMNLKWFDNVKDTPRLLDARKSDGQGGRGHIIAPLFCPFLVMQWQIDPQKKKGRTMSSSTGWRMLKAHFPSVYADHMSADPSAD